MITDLHIGKMNVYLARSNMKLSECTINDIITYCRQHANYKYETDERKCAKRCPFGELCLVAFKVIPCHLYYSQVNWKDEIAEIQVHSTLD